VRLGSGGTLGEGGGWGGEQSLVLGGLEFEVLGDLLDDAELVGVDRAVEVGDPASF